MVLNLSNFIYSLLLENETVIIPGFGAFVSTYKPAEISENEIKPPSKEITFTQQIKNNDGMLAEIIARKAKISQLYAMKRIERARENMLYELDKGETIIVENIGELFYNEKNEIQFSPYNENNLLVDSFGLETISTEDFAEGKIDAEIVDEKINPLLQAKETVPFPAFKPSPAIENKKKRRKAVWYWYFLILIPVLIGGYFLLNNTSNSGNSEINNSENSKIEQNEIKGEAVLPVDTIQSDSILAETASASNPVNEEQNRVVSNEITKHYLVGGGFKSEENVEKFILQLKERGIEGFSLGKKGSLFLVGIGSYDTETDAQNVLNETQKKYPEWNLWIYKK